jgi:hypothetical protein
MSDEEAARKLAETMRDLEATRTRQSMKSYIMSKARRMKSMRRRGG